MNHSNPLNQKAFFALCISVILLCFALNLTFFYKYGQFAPEAEGSADMFLMNSKNNSAYLLLSLSTILFSLLVCILNFYLTYFRENRLERAQPLGQDVQSKIDNAGKFLTHLAHEIRTPLTSILGYSQLLSAQQHHRKSTEFIKSIHQSGKHLLKLTDQMLDIGKIQQGIVAFEHQPFNLAELFESVEHMFKSLLTDKEIFLKINMPSNAQQVVIGDESRLRQILINLVGNALKFTHEGGVVVNVTQDIVGQSAHLRIEIEDSGIGIDESKLPYIFDEFRQGDDYTQKQFGGMGLGLFLTKKLIILQQGKITCSSKTGVGTCFTIYLSYAIPQNIGLNRKDRMLPSLNPRLRNALLIEDNPAVYSIMEHLCKRWHIILDLAKDANSAFECMKQKEYDLLFIDLHLPDMDGYAAARSIRDNIGYSRPIIAMTAGIIDNNSQKWKTSGIDSYLLKPVEVSTFRKLLFRILETRGSLSQEEIFPPKLDIEQIKKSRVINVDYLLEVSNGNLAYQQSVVSQFQKLVPEALAQIYNALHERKFDELAAIAHGLRSSVNIMGMAGALPLLDTLEYDEVTNEFPAIIYSLENMCLQAISELDGISEEFARGSLISDNHYQLYAPLNQLNEKSAPFAESWSKSIEKKQSA